ncbi:MAG TPA: hypothetical protein VK400_08670 [Pyrinomonadaceae bacterium]|nr:hypothetical protein [Pyrinomonadaceae bacterium]
MKQITALVFIVGSLVFSIFGQPDLKPIKIKGEVVAYLKPNVPHLSSIVYTEELIVKVKASNSFGNYIKLLNIYLGDKNHLPTNLYTNGGDWRFTAKRRVDCDSVLRPNVPEVPKIANTEIEDKNNLDKTDNSFVILFDQPEINFIVAEASLNIPNNKVLPCYEILSLKKN